MKIEELISGKSEFIKGVFYLGSGEFSYSDGDRAEKYIYDVLQSASDISSQSSELEGKIVDWSSRYHFSSSRANCYRAVNFKAGARVLEIGSGCGSITRYLGETGLEVIALEGSPRRAEITRIRTRDLANVTVICGSFSEVQFKTSFDYVVCNGVLEYAPLFVNADDPSDAFIKRVFGLLSPDGALLLAIENKLGLRYFVGGKEEHTGILYDGIEDYPRFPGGVKTHSKSELLKLIGKYFCKIELLLPLPDYKFPRAIVRSELTSLVNCGELFGAMEDYAFPTMTRANFHQRLGWHSVADAGLLSEMSNSHFLIAQNKLNEVLAKEWQGEIFKREHRNQTFKSSQIVSKQSGGNVIIGLQDRLFPSESSQTLSPWIEGRSLHSRIASAMLRKNANPFNAEETQKVLCAWWGSIARGDDGRILGSNVDAIWRNSICSGNHIILIDQDSGLSAPISEVHLIYRSVLNFVHDEMPFEHRWVLNYRFLSEYRIVSLVARSIGVKISIKELLMSVQNEIILQTNLGYGRAGYIRRCIRLMLPIAVIRNIGDMKSKISKLTSRIKNRLFP
jgi:2-polyprenyl-3-methyl-5-hydroxy-6-metoxy-1,4-benzoquinol methylase